MGQHCPDLNICFQGPHDNFPRNLCKHCICVMFQLLRYILVQAKVCLWRKLQGELRISNFCSACRVEVYHWVEATQSFIGGCYGICKGVIDEADIPCALYCPNIVPGAVNSLSILHGQVRSILYKFSNHNGHWHIMAGDVLPPMDAVH